MSTLHTESLPTIETWRLGLRPITFDDLPALAQLWGDPEVMCYLPTGRPRPIDATRAELHYMIRHWQEYGFGVWAITLKSCADFIGYCGLQYFHAEPGGVSAEAIRNGNDVELVAGLTRKHWGQGIITEASRAALREKSRSAQADSSELSPASKRFATSC